MFEQHPLPLIHLVTEMRILNYLETSVKMLLDLVAVNYQCRFIRFLIFHVTKIQINNESPKSLFFVIRLTYKEL